MTEPIICHRCHRDIRTAFTCDPDGHAAPFGTERELLGLIDPDPDPSSETSCRDCGVTVGGSHHLFCTVAICRTCLADPDPMLGQWFCCPHMVAVAGELGLET